MLASMLSLLPGDKASCIASADRQVKGLMDMDLFLAPFKALRKELKDNFKVRLLKMVMRERH